MRCVSLFPLTLSFSLHAFPTLGLLSSPYVFILLNFASLLSKSFCLFFVDVNSHFLSLWIPSVGKLLGYLTIYYTLCVGCIYPFWNFCELPTRLCVVSTNTAVEYYQPHIGIRVALGLCKQILPRQLTFWLCRTFRTLLCKVYKYINRDRGTVQEDQQQLKIPVRAQVSCYRFLNYFNVSVLALFYRGHRRVERGLGSKIHRLAPALQRIRTSLEFHFRELSFHPASSARSGRSARGTVSWSTQSVHATTAGIRLIGREVGPIAR